MCCTEANQGASACTHWHMRFTNTDEDPSQCMVCQPRPLRGHSGQASLSNTQPELTCSRTKRVHGCMAEGTAQKHGCHSTPGDKSLLPTNTACISRETIRWTTRHTGAHRSWICVRTGALAAYQCRKCASSQPNNRYTLRWPTPSSPLHHLSGAHASLHPLPQPCSSAPAHASAGAAVGRQAWRPAQRRALRKSHGRRPPPAQARPWCPTAGFDAAPPCVRCVLPSCTGSAVVLLDGAHAAEAGHAGVHAQPGQRNVRAPAARAY